MRIIPLSPDSDYTDAELISGIRSFDNACSTLLYKKHRDYCLRFMRKMYDDEEEIKDIYQDAIILFIEKVRDGKFELNNASIQTYLNSVCRRQILVRLKDKKRPKLYSEFADGDFDDSIVDWHEEDQTLNQERLQITMEELDKMKSDGGKCYEILYLFFFRKSSMESIASGLGYSNADNAKNQKSRCQKRLREAINNRAQLC